LPHASAIDCTPKDNCDATRRCDQPHDERDCKTGLGFNDPVCELAKASQNTIYAEEKGRCEAQKASEKLICEGRKATKKGLCETEKGIVDAISRTGNFANLEGSVGGPAALKVCLSSVNFTQDLSSISLAMAVSGTAELATHIKFIPLDIVGHLTCQFPWAEDRTLRASVPEQQRPLTTRLVRKKAGEQQTLSGRTNDIPLRLHI
jgi:hypothetical protein